MGRFEDDFARHLREELDRMEIRLPVARPAIRSEHSWRPYGIVPRLALAAAATIAIALLASAFTGSTNPTVWVKPASWMRSFGIAPPSPTPSPTHEREEKTSPSPTSEPESSQRPGPPEHESGTPSTGGEGESSERSGGDARSPAPGATREPDD